MTSRLRTRRIHAQLAALSIVVNVLLAAMFCADALGSLARDRADEVASNAERYALRIAHEISLVAPIQLTGRDRGHTLSIMMDSLLARTDEVDAIGLYYDLHLSPKTIEAKRRAHSIAGQASAIASTATASVQAGPLAGAQVSVRVGASLNPAEISEIVIVTSLLMFVAGLIALETLSFALERGPWQRERVLQRLVHNAVLGHFGRVWRGSPRCEADLRAPLLAGRMLALTERYKRVARLAASHARIETCVVRQTLLRDIAARVRGMDALDGKIRVHDLPLARAYHHRFAALLHGAVWSATAVLLHPSPGSLTAFAAGAVAGSIGRLRPGTAYLVFFIATGLAQAGLIVDAAPLPEALLGAGGMLGLRAALAFEQRMHSRQLTGSGAALGALLVGPLFALLALRALTPSANVLLLSASAGIGLLTMLHAWTWADALPARRGPAPRLRPLVAAALLGLASGFAMRGALGMYESTMLTDVTAGTLCFCAWAGTREPSRYLSIQLAAFAVLGFVSWTANWLTPVVVGGVLWLGMRGRSRLYRRPAAQAVALTRVDCAAFAAGTLVAHCSLFAGLPGIDDVVSISAGALIMCAAWLLTLRRSADHAVP